MAESKKSNFSVTCSLLSQYLKKNRSFADLGAIAQEPTNGLNRPPTTLNLLPGLDVSAENQTETEDATKSQPENAQLTIFYGGKVMVFDNFPAEKAADLMNLESFGSSAAAPAGSATVPMKINASEMPMPIARRASLHRFLEKRKDRINSKAPYQIDESSKVGSTPKPQEAKSWLGLGQEISS